MSRVVVASMKGGGPVVKVFESWTAYDEWIENNDMFEDSDIHTCSCSVTEEGNYE